MTASRILVTGAAGFLGSSLVRALERLPHNVVALDVRPPSRPSPAQNIQWETMDLRDHAALAALFARFRPTCVVHLASIVTPPPGMSREDMHAIDVGGTRRLVELCVQHSVQQLIVTTSGAAYGYHPDNAAWLTEDCAIRGNVEFAYSDHKRQIEELLAATVTAHPALKVLVLRPGTILGAHVGNQITALFRKPRVLGIRGHDSPFVFIWDDDVVGILVQGIEQGTTGAFNVAGDGAMSMREIAQALGKPYVEVPAWVLRAALTVLHPLGIVPYGPEQVRFLQYRPVLLNEKLKKQFAYTPRMTSREAFEALLRAQPDLRSVPAGGSPVNAGVAG